MTKNIVCIRQSRDLRGEGDEYAILEKKFQNGS